MQSRLEARQRSVIQSEPTAVYADITPLVGQAWQIIAGYGYHDEGAPLTCLWALDSGDGSGFRDLCLGAALASGVYRHVYADVPCQLPLILRFGQTLRWNCAAKTPTKHAVIVLVIDEIVGETPYVG
jgi:hypothetical protein